MTKTWDSPQEGHRSRQSRDGRWGWKEENILALTSRSAFTRHSVQSLVPGVGRRCWGQIALTHRWHWAWPRRVPSPMDKTVSLLVGCSRSNRGGLFHKINFQATYWLNCAGISEVHHAVPNYKPSHQNVECFLTNSWLLGHWMGRFLLQALDWIDPKVACALTKMNRMHSFVQPYKNYLSHSANFEKYWRAESSRL